METHFNAPHLKKMMPHKKSELLPPLEPQEDDKQGSGMGFVFFLALAIGVMMAGFVWGVVLKGGAL